jgi:hypothetical protein
MPIKLSPPLSLSVDSITGGLVIALPLNDSSNPTIDLVNHANNATLVNNPSWKTGFYGSVDLECGNPYLTSPTISFLTAPFSFFVLVRAGVSPSSISGVASADNLNTIDGIFYLYLYNDTSVFYGVKWSSDNSANINCLAGEVWPNPPTSPHLLGFTVDNSNVRLYLDGILKHTTSTGGTHFPSLSNLGKIYLGIDWYNGTIVDSIDNYLSYVLAWNRVLSDTDVSNLNLSLFRWATPIIPVTLSGSSVNSISVTGSNVVSISENGNNSAAPTLIGSNIATISQSGSNVASINLTGHP